MSTPAVTVRITAKPRAPTRLISYAARQRDAARDDFGEVWCVFDVDEFPDVARATAPATEHGIRVAVSHPCFELWLVLHFTDHTAYARTYRQLLPHLIRHLPRYDKSALRFREFADGRERAAVRGRRLAPAGEEHEVNPATGMWALAESIGGEPRTG